MDLSDFYGNKGSFRWYLSDFLLNPSAFLWHLSDFLLNPSAFRHHLSYPLLNTSALLWHLSDPLLHRALSRVESFFSPLKKEPYVKDSYLNCCIKAVMICLEDHCSPDTFVIGYSRGKIDLVISSTV